MSGAQDPPNGDGPVTAENGAQPDEIRTLLSGLTELKTVLEREHERAAHRETIIDRLHEDNQTLRRGELQAMFEPIRAALYRLHDMTRRESERWASPDPPDPEHAARLLTAVTDEIAEALARTGVERFAARVGETFDPARHRPVATEPVMDPALDGAVVRVLSDGFEQSERVVRKAEVCVGRPAPNTDSATTGTSESAPLPRPNR